MAAASMTATGMTATELASYLLNRDNSGRLQDMNLYRSNGTESYEGNIRLNKYLYFLQILFLAKTGRLLFTDDIIALPNGPASASAINKYKDLVQDHPSVPQLDHETAEFIDRFIYCFRNATTDDLIEISHQDDPWAQAQTGRVIDCLKNYNYYKNTCEEMLTTMYRIENYDKNWASTFTKVPV